MARKTPLRVWLYGTHVANLKDGGPGRLTATYTPEALDCWPLNTAVLSCSLPLSRRPMKRAGLYFRGMLPEGHALQAMAQEAGVTTLDTYGLLERFGRDVAGAAVITTEAVVEPRAGHTVSYTADELADDVGSLEAKPLAIHDDSELSLPGLQNKMLLVRTATGWARPAEGFPSTHILKVEDRRFPGMAVAEAAALALARTIGLTTVEAHTETIAGIETIIISRFDRLPALKPGQPGRPAPSRRVHQEDACQALGINAEAARGRGKYQDAGGPSLAQVASVLDEFAVEPSKQLAQLLAATVFTVVIGNADAHGKNLSFVHIEPGVVELSPLYDTVPTLLWPKLRGNAAMTVNGVGRLDAVTRDDLITEARGWKMGGRTAGDVVLRVLDQIRSAATSLDLPPEFAEMLTRRASALLR